jgi:hypothetical protein
MAEALCYKPALIAEEVGTVALGPTLLLTEMSARYLPVV